jgi:CheY-like chemotaxis protein
MVSLRYVIALRIERGGAELMPEAKKIVILAVEDHPFVIMDIEITLLEAGYAVLLATNADIALRHLNVRSDIALVLTDIKLPGSLDGLGLMNMIRHLWPSIKIIIVTADIDNAEIPKEVLIVSKPFLSASLLACVAEILSPVPGAV